MELKSFNRLTHNEISCGYVCLNVSVGYTKELRLFIGSDVKARAVLLLIF